MKSGRADIFVASALVLLAGIYTLAITRNAAVPHEDAAILMRYAHHLGQGQGIVWNVGEPPVDGATDFLFMALLAGLVKAGLSIEQATRLVSMGAHLVTVLLVYCFIRGLHRANRWIAGYSALFLATGPGSTYVAAYLGTPVFALAACVAWYCANKVARDPKSPAWSVAFPAAAFIMGLVRPEGVFLAVFMLIAIFYMAGVRRSRRCLLFFVLVFGVFGGLYLSWKWSYFGDPLPNPFYKKGGGLLYWSSLLGSIRNVIYMGGPFLLFFLLIRSRDTFRQAVFALLPIVGFTAIWVLLSDRMNYAARYQYAVLPILLISWPAMLENLRRDFKLPAIQDLPKTSRTAAVMFLLALSLGVILYHVRQYRRVRCYPDGRHDLALALKAYSPHDYCLATTEAGLLPLYSTWRTLDAWGLNDPWIARHGRITEVYLDRFRPEVIMFHAYFSPLVPAPEPSDPWSGMVGTLKSYAERNGYILAAALGTSPFDTHHYYVRADFPESAEIVEKIRGIDYAWYRDGRKSLNYATLDTQSPTENPVLRQNRTGHR